MAHKHESKPLYTTFFAHLKKYGAADGESCGAFWRWFCNVDTSLLADRHKGLEAAVESEVDCDFTNCRQHLKRNACAAVDYRTLRSLY